MNKIIPIILSFLLLSIGFTTVTTIAENSTILLNSKNKIYVGGSGPGNYTSIQTAINDVSAGGTVYIYNGTYYEHHILIEKKICLLGENKNSTIIDVVGKHQGIQIYYDEVVSIEDSQCETFDMHVPNGHEYCANGFFSHNSKIRGLRANYLIADEFSSVPEETFEVVIKGFAAVTSSPAERVQQVAKANTLKEQGLFSEAAAIDPTEITRTIKMRI